MAIKFYGGHQLNSKAKVYGTRQDFEVIEVDENGDPITEPTPYIVVSDIRHNSNTGRVYIYDSNDLSASPTILEESGTGQFGKTSSYGTTLFVGSPHESTQTGALYVYDDITDASSPTKLTAYDGSSGDYFGQSSSANGTYLAVGASFASTNGVVYVFDMNDYSTQPTKLVSPSSSGSVTFGQDVRMNQTHLFVAGPGYNNQGAVFAYDLSDLSASPVVFSSPSPENYSQFGIGIDATDTHLLITHSGDDTMGNNAGAGYVYDLSDMSAAPTKLTPADLGANDHAGYTSAAISDTHVAFGGLYHDPSGIDNAGAVWVYDVTNLSATPTKVTALAPPTSGGFFGQSLTIGGDSMLVGENGTRSAYVFDLTDLSADPIELSSGLPSGGFGEGPNDIVVPPPPTRYYKTLATQYVPPPIPPASFFMVAGPYSDIQATNAGRVYIFDSITENGQTPDSYIEAPLGAGSYFGSQIVQNSTQIAIGAYGEEGLEGSAYLYDKSDLTATPIRLHPAAAQPMDFTSSYALSMSDNHLVMGAFGDDDVGSTSGSAYVYDLNTNQVIKKLLPPGGGANTRFGSNAAVSDTHVAVTSGGNDGGAFQQSIFLWELSNLNATPTHIHPTSYSSIVEGGFGGGQGLTLHIHDNKLFASNRSTSSSDNWAGEVYMFDMNDLSAEPTIFEIPLVRIGQSIRVENDKLYVSALGTGIYIWDLNDTSADPVFLEKPAGTSGDFAGYISVAGSSLITGDENHLSNQGAAFLYDLNDLSADPIMVTSGSGQEEYLGKVLLAVE